MIKIFCCMINFYCFDLLHYYQDLSQSGFICYKMNVYFFPANIGFIKREKSPFAHAHEGFAGAARRAAAFLLQPPTNVLLSYHLK